MREFIKEKDRKVLTQYMIRYGIVVMATAGLILVLMNWALLQYEDRVIQDATKVLRDNFLNLDTCLEMQQEIAVEMYLNSLSMPEHMLDSYLDAKEGIDQIKLYWKTLEINDYVLVHYQAEEVFTQDGSITLENVIEKMLKLNKRSREIFVEMIGDHSRIRTEVLTDQDGENMLVYFYPMLNSLIEGKDMIGFVIRGETLKTYLREELENTPMYAVMIGKNGEILFENNTLKGVASREIDKLREQLLARNGYLMREYSYYSYESENGFSFYCALQNDVLLESLNKIFLSVFGIGILIFGVAMGVISVLNCVNVRRIVSVRDELLCYHGDEATLKEKDEFRQILHMIRSMHQEQKKNDVVREQVAGILCGGLIRQEEILEELVQRCCPGLLSPYYKVLSVVAEVQREPVITELIGKEPLDLFIVERCQDMWMCSFIVGLEEPEDDRHNELAEHLLGRTHRAGIDNVFIATGRVCTQLCEIRNSYQGMLSMVYYQLLVMGMWTGQIFLFEKVVEESRKRLFAEEDLESLDQALADGSIEDVLKVLGRLAEEIDKDENAMIRGFRRIVLCEILYERLDQLGVNAEQTSRLRRMEVDDGEIFLKEMTSIVKKSCVEVEVPIGAIMNFIDTHYKDSTLGLEAIAFRFKMSASAVSRYIKEQNGKKYSEYISELRLKEACRLLAETDVKIQEIPFEIGYKDYVSFSKKFKLAIGVSPREYRAERRKECLKS